MPILSFLNSNNNRNHNPTKRMRVGGFGWTSAQLLELNHICQPNTWGSCAYPPSVFGHRYRPTHILDTKKNAPAVTVLNMQRFLMSYTQWDRCFAAYMHPRSQFWCVHGKIGFRIKRKQLLCTSYYDHTHRKYRSTNC